MLPDLRSLTSVHETGYTFIRCDVWTSLIDQVQQSGCGKNNINCEDRICPPAWKALKQCDSVEYNILTSFNCLSQIPRKK